LAEPKLSVVIPAYNSARTLARAIESVLAQTEPDFELIVADDGSSDDTAAVAERFAAADPRVQVMRIEPNGGKPRALNRVLPQARGRWIALLDADDWYAPARLAVLTALAEREGADIVADNQYFVDFETGARVATAFDPALPARRLMPPDLISDHAGRRFDFALLKLVVKAEFVRRHDLRFHEDARMVEDFFFLFDCLAAGGRVWVSPVPLYSYVLPSSPSSGQWHETGGGAWRYRGRFATARAVCEAYLGRAAPGGDAALLGVLRWRRRHYGALEHWLAAVEAWKGERRPDKAAAILLAHPVAIGVLIDRLRLRWSRAAPA